MLKLADSLSEKYVLERKIMVCLDNILLAPQMDPKFREFNHNEVSLKRSDM